MGVYIKGMEMPSSCGECLNIGWNYVFECDLDDVESGERRLDCPLAPVPPHGRLIDADELGIYRREERAWTDLEHSPFSEYLEGVKDGLHEAAKCLSTAPTIIPAEPFNNLSKPCKKEKEGE